MGVPRIPHLQRDKKPLMAGFGMAGSQLPQTITAGGKTRLVSQHLRNDPHLGITTERIERVIEHWIIRGIRTERDGSQSRCYIAFVPGLDEMVRVAVSMDDEVIITGFRDRTATRHWNTGNRGYFVRNYQNLEERNAG